MKKTHLIILSLFLTSAIIITAAVITYKALTVPKSKKYVVETIEANSKEARHFPSYLQGCQKASENRL